MSSARSLIISILSSVMCLLPAGWAGAQEYPAKPIRIIVADSAGASWDLVARLIGSEMSKLLGQPIVVENKPGASYSIGLGYVAKQVPADGYTIALSAIPGLTILPLTMKDLPFDPLKDFQPIVTLVEGKIVVGTSSQFPWKTFDAMIAQAKATPGKLNYGGSGANSRLQMEAIVRGSGVDVTYIPYRAGATYLQGLITGEVHMGILTETSASSYGDKMRVLAVTGAKRSEFLPNVPTFTEVGHPEIRGIGYVLLAPVGVPRRVIDRLHGAAVSALRQPELKAQFAKFKLETIGDSSEESAKRVADESKLFADVARKIGIQPE